MPIKEENKSRYPKNWAEIRANILKRAKNKCEFCGVENYSVRDNGSKVVLTIAHLDHKPENNDPSNLRALCQKCHNKYDAEHRAKTRELTRLWKDKVFDTLTIDNVENGMVFQSNGVTFVRVDDCAYMIDTRRGIRIDHFEDRGVDLIFDKNGDLVAITKETKLLLEKRRLD